MADLPASGAAKRPDFSDAEIREIVVEHVPLPALAFHRVHHLLVSRSPQRGRHQALCFAAGEQRRSVRPRQNAYLTRDVTYVGVPATVHTNAVLEDHSAHLRLFDVLEHSPDITRLLRIFLFEPCKSVVEYLTQRALPFQFLFDSKRVFDPSGVRLGKGDIELFDFLRFADGELLGFSHQIDQLALQSVEVFNHLMPESHACENVLFAYLFCTSLDHHNGVVGTRHHDVNVTLFDLLCCRVGNETTFHSADPYARHHRLERNVRKPQRRRRAGYAENVRMDFAVEAHRLRYDLSLTVEILGEQWSKGTIDQARR